MSNYTKYGRAGITFNNTNSNFGDAANHLLKLAATANTATWSGTSGGAVAFAGLSTIACSGVITAATAPTADAHLCNKAYVDGVAQGLDPKDAVFCATTAALGSATYSAGAGTITANANGAFGPLDGVTPSQDVRILVKDGVTGATGGAAVANGIYTLTNAGGEGAAYVLTRAADMNGNAEVAGAYVLVQNGTANAAKGFVVTSPDDGAGFTIGSTDITWTQFSGGGSVSVDDVTIESGGSGLNVKAAGIGATQLATNAVTEQKIQDNAVTSAKIQDNAVTSAKIATDAVGASELANNAVDTAAIADDAVTALKIAANAVGASELADNAVDTAAIADDAVTAAKIAADAVGASELANDAVDTNAIANAAVTAAKIAGAVAGDGLTGGAGSALAVGAGTGMTVNANDVAVTAAQTGITSIYNTSLIIGDSATGNTIDMLTAEANTMLIKLNNADALKLAPTQLTMAISGTNELKLTGTVLGPITSKGLDLGSTSEPFNDVFLDSVLNFNNGDVIATATNGDLAFTKNGGTCSLTAEDFIISSDETLKNISGECPYGLEEIKRLPTIAWTWKSESDVNNPTEHYGFSAQKTEEIMPDLVTVKSDGNLGIRRGMDGVIVKAIQEMATNYESRLEQLEQQIARLI